MLWWMLWCCAVMLCCVVMLCCDGCRVAFMTGNWQEKIDIKDNKLISISFIFYTLLIVRRWLGNIWLLSLFSFIPFLLWVLSGTLLFCLVLSRLDKGFFKTLQNTVLDLLYFYFGSRICLKLTLITLPYLLYFLVCPFWPVLGFYHYGKKMKW